MEKEANLYDFHNSNQMEASAHACMQYNHKNRSDSLSNWSQEGAALRKSARSTASISEGARIATKVSVACTQFYLMFQEA